MTGMIRDGIWYRKIVVVVRKLVSVRCCHKAEQWWTSQRPRICKQWRDISVDSPALWTSFLVVAREGHLTTEAFGQAHLSRPKLLPLQICVRFPSDKEAVTDV
ncbi:hypothetical protein C8J56DRAFT_900601 [Mycena floridula]|nr:hypothetical protein C8J56DRAFT_900601 [Mycena floridula]